MFVKVVLRMILGSMVGDVMLILFEESTVSAQDQNLFVTFAG